MNNQEGDNSFDEVVQNLGELYASVYNETDLPIKDSDDGLAIFIGKENLYYTIKDLSPKSSSIFKTDVSYSKDMLSLNIMLKNDDKLVFDSQETHYVKTFGNQQPIVRLRVKSSLIRVVNNGDQKILSLRMATSKEAVMKSKKLD